MPRRGRSYLANILVLLVTLVVCVALVDAVAYFVLGIRGLSHGAEGFIQFSPLLGHFHKPLTEGRYYPSRGRDGHEVSMNSRGFCDVERDIEKTRPRIILIGDSTTEAWEVDPDERPHVVLEEILGGRFEVLNLGVQGLRDRPEPHSARAPGDGVRARHRRLHVLRERHPRQRQAPRETLLRDRPR